MTDGSTVQGAIDLKPGGSAYVDLVPSPRGSTGEIAITIANDSAETQAHVMAISYPAPATSAPVMSHWGLGGRGERWHAFEETQVPTVYPASWDRIWLDAGSSTSRFELDSIEIVQGCAGT
jgi:hypothetical protein